VKANEEELAALASARNELERLWVEMNVDPTDVARFLSDIDLNAPYVKREPRCRIDHHSLETSLFVRFCEAVYNLYHQEEARLKSAQIE